MGKKNDLKEKIPYITFLQAISALSVVILHTNGVFWIYSNDGYWPSANLIESLFYFAVPIFLMITGITLINFKARYGIGEFYRRRFIKTVLPYVFWSLFGFFYNLYWGVEDVSHINISYMLNGLFNSTFVRIYWFFPVLFGIYLCMPLFASIAKEERKSSFEYLLICGLILNVFIPSAQKLIPSDLNFSYSLAVASEYLIYPIGGVLLYYYPPQKKVKNIVLILGFIGFLFHFCGTYSLSVEAGYVVSKYKGYTNFPCVLYSFAVLVGLRDICEKLMSSIIIRSTINVLANNALPIYLLHYFFLDSARRLFNFDETTWIYRVCAPIIVILIVIGLSYVLRKIPLVRDTLP